ncbi:MAG: response regulator [Kiloniellales bacterium]|nr:response regulator [Kiloniellales bacterium]
MSDQETAFEILVVEDQGVLRKLIVHELSAVGYRTRQASNGREALNAIRSNRPDLILSDVEMPEMGGFDLLRQIRAGSDNGRPIPFIFLSGLSDAKQIQSGLELGASDYVTKPVDFGILIAKVRNRLQENHVSRQHQEQQLVKLYKAMSRQAAPGEAASPTEGGDADGAAPALADGSDERQRLLRILEAKDGKVVAARIFINNMCNIREAFGPRWRAWAERTRSFAESIIRAKAAGQAVVSRNEDGDFVICFAQLNAMEAQAFCLTVIEEIGDKFFGGEDGQASPHFNYHVQDVELTADSVEDCYNLADVCIARMLEPPGNSPAARRKLVQGIAGSTKIITDPVQLNDGGEAPLKLTRFDPTTKKQVETWARTLLGFSDVVAGLDVMMIAKVVEILAEAPTEDRRLLSLDLHSSTLLHAAYRSQFVSVLSQIPSAIRERLAIHIVDNPSNDYLPAPLIASLLDLAKIVIFEMHSLEADGLHLKGKKLAILSIDYDKLFKYERLDEKSIDRVANEIHRHGPRFLVKGVPEAKWGTLSRSGIDMICFDSGA